MSIALIPEIVLYNTLKGLLTFLKVDYNNQSDKQYSYLYELLSGIKMDKYDYFTQAESVFITEVDDPRDIQVNMMLNMQTSRFPCIHLTIPSEQYDASGNGMGVDQGYADYLFNDQLSQYNETFTRSTSANYNLVITSDNSNEVVMIYHILKHLLMSAENHLALSGFKNLKVGGQDLQIMQDLDNKSVYFRSITIGFSYDSSSLSLFNTKYTNSVTFHGTPVFSLTPQGVKPPVPSVPAGIHVTISFINNSQSVIHFSSINGNNQNSFQPNVSGTANIELTDNVFVVSQQNTGKEIIYLYARKATGAMDGSGTGIYPPNSDSFPVNLGSGYVFESLAIPKSTSGKINVLNFSKIDNLSAVITDYKGATQTITIANLGNNQVFDISTLGNKISSITITGLGTSLIQATLVGPNFDVQSISSGGSVTLSPSINIKNELYLFLLDTASPSSHE